MCFPVCASLQYKNVRREWLTETDFFLRHVQHALVVQSRVLAQQAPELAMLPVFIINAPRQECSSRNYNVTNPFDISVVFSKIQLLPLIENIRYLFVGLASKSQVWYTHSLHLLGYAYQSSTLQPELDQSLEYQIPLSVLSLALLLQHDQTVVK